LERLSERELSDLCRERNLDASGTKADHLRRLMSFKRSVARDRYEEDEHDRDRPYDVCDDRGYGAGPTRGGVSPRKTASEATLTTKTPPSPRPQQELPARKCHLCKGKMKCIACKGTGLQSAGGGKIGAKLGASVAGGEIGGQGQFAANMTCVACRGHLSCHNCKGSGMEPA
jgi:hypothetical protein